MKVKSMRVSDLKELGQELYKELYGREFEETSFYNAITESDEFQNVIAYRGDVLENFQKQYSLICDCGHTQRSGRYRATDDVCENCGGSYFASQTIAETFELDGALGLVVSKATKTRNEEGVKHRLEIRDVVLVSENHVNAQNSLRASGAIYNGTHHRDSVKGIVKQVSYLLDNQRTAGSLHEVGDSQVVIDLANKIIAEKEEAAFNRKPAKTARQKFIDAFTKEKTKVLKEDTGKYLYVSVKDDDTAVRFTEKGIEEFPYVVTETSYRHKPATIKDIFTNEEYKLDKELLNGEENRSKFNFFLDEDNNLFGIAHKVSYSFSSYNGEFTAERVLDGGFFFNKKNEARSIDSGGGTISANNRWRSTIAEYDPEELKEVLEKSNQKGYMVDFAIKFATETYIDNSEVKRSTLSSRKLSSMSITLSDYPFVESVYKMGFKNIASDVASNPNTYARYKGYKSIYDVLGFKDKAFTKALSRRNVSFRELISLGKIFEADQKRSSPDDILWFLDEGLTYRDYNIVDAIKHLTSARRLKDYLINVLDYQCIAPNESITILADYYRMAERLDYDMTRKNVLVPSSLKKEHDIATFSYRAIQDQVSMEEFIEAAQSYKHLEYKQKSKKGLMVVAPTEPKDVIGEGKSLHHCVGSYVNTIRDRRTQVLFIRRQEEPTVPYYTVEVSPSGVVTQVRGLQNKAANPGVSSFVREWAKERKLLVRY